MLYQTYKYFAHMTQLKTDKIDRKLRDESLATLMCASWRFYDGFVVFWRFLFEIYCFFG